MPIPRLKPVFEAANVAYRDARKPKDDSYLFQALLTAGSLFGYADTSGSKKSTLTELATAEEDKSTPEEQNKALVAKLAEAKKFDDGEFFKALHGILVFCGRMALDPLNNSPVDFYFQAREELLLVQNTLGHRHYFFLALGLFCSDLDKYMNEQLHASLAEAKREQGEAETLRTQLVSETAAKKVLSEQLKLFQAEAKEAKEAAQAFSTQLASETAAKKALSEQLKLAQAEAKEAKEAAQALSTQLASETAAKKALSEQLKLAQAEAKEAKEAKEAAQALSTQLASETAAKKALSEQLKLAQAEAKEAKEAAQALKAQVAELRKQQSVQQEALHPHQRRVAMAASIHTPGKPADRGFAGSGFGFDFGFKDPVKPEPPKAPGEPQAQARQVAPLTPSAVARYSLT